MKATLTLVAAALAAHVALGLLVADAGPVGPDGAAFDVFDPLHAARLTDVVAVLTDVGAFPVVVIVAAAGVAYAVRDGRSDRALALLAGFVAVFVLVSLTKQLWDRPRPADMLTGARGLSYPSGHSAQSVTWLAAAAVTGRRGLMLTAAAVVVAVMASRLYLHVHYLTDVVGGTALAIAVYAPVLVKR